MQERGTVATLTGEVGSESDRPTSHWGWSRLAGAFAVAALVVVVDQLTKWWAVSRLSHGPVHVIGPLDFELQRNTGSAFSLFQGDAAVLVVIAVVLIVALLILAGRAPTSGRAVVLGLILGGALGNLADRLFRGGQGAVVDFVALHVWPTFNVADSCIVVGCVLLVVSLLRTGRPS
ncbi:MAG: signal peptidase II [Acidimicrobiales bacterium]